MKEILQAIIDDKPLVDGHGQPVELLQALRRLGEGLPVRVKPATCHRYMPILQLPAGALVVAAGVISIEDAKDDNLNRRLSSEKLTGILHIEIEPETLKIHQCEILKL